jgi:hypothetical protein
MIHTCTCNHDSQDKLHGSKRRVMNQMTKDKAKVRCTVCKKEHQISGK